MPRACLRSQSGRVTKTGVLFPDEDTMGERATAPGIQNLQRGTIDTIEKASVRPGNDETRYGERACSL